MGRALVLLMSEAISDSMARQSIASSESSWLAASRLVLPAGTPSSRALQALSSIDCSSNLQLFMQSTLNFHLHPQSLSYLETTVKKWKITCFCNNENTMGLSITYSDISCAVIFDEADIDDESKLSGHEKIAIFQTNLLNQRKFPNHRKICPYHLLSCQSTPCLLASPYGISAKQIHNDIRRLNVKSAVENISFSQSHRKIHIPEDETSNGTKSGLLLPLSAVHRRRGFGSEVRTRQFSIVLSNAISISVSMKRYRWRKSGFMWLGKKGLVLKLSGGDGKQEQDSKCVL
ncbi:Phox-associated domain, partial [Striga asiatica]